jgi:hypothetical protein
LTASSPNQSLIHQILQGATRKLLLIGNDDSTDSSVISPPVRNSQKEDRTSLMGQYTYYVREGHRSGESMIHNMKQTAIYVPDCY